MSIRHGFASFLFSLGTASAMATPSPVAEYGLNGTFASSLAGAPALTVTDPLGQSGFGTDLVNGVSRTVYNFAGQATPLSAQAGLTLNTSGLITANNVYSLEIVFKFTQNDNAWRRIVDVQSRQSDNGFYVDPGNTLDIYPVGGGSSFTNGIYHDVFLVDNAGTATFYLDGSAQAVVTTTVMDLDSSRNINFFLDNLVGGGQGEWSGGSVASIRLYDAALDAVPPPTPPVVPSVPEPQSYAVLLLGLAALGAVLRRHGR